MIKRTAFKPIAKEVVTNPIEEAAAKLAKLTRADGTVELKSLKEEAAHSGEATKAVLERVASGVAEYTEVAVNYSVITEPEQLSAKQTLSAQRQLAGAQARLSEIMGTDQRLDPDELKKIVPGRTDVQNGDLYDIALAAAGVAVTAAAAENPWPKSAAEIPEMNPIYTTPSSRSRTVAILGASSNESAISQSVGWAATIARKVVERGGNVVTGAGNSAVMGAAFKAAREASELSGSGENLTLIKEPMWGDEDLAGGRAIGKAPSEEQRLEKFMQVASTVVALPGGAGTMLEINKLVFALSYPSSEQLLPDKVVLAGAGQYWAGLKEQLETMVAKGQLKAKVLERFVWPDDEKALLKALG